MKKGQKGSNLCPLLKFKSGLLQKLTKKFVKNFKIFEKSPLFVGFCPLLKTKVATVLRQS